MLAFAHRFPQWKNFPLGLHVMVVDQDKQVLDDMKLKLEACDYAVTTFSSGHDALAALRDCRSTFHAAIVEAARNEELDGFQILEAARHLTTIMMSQADNLTIMMQGIAAGASEFLQKPVSQDKVKNIWQHVVRKALLTGELVLPKSLLPSVSMSPQYLSCANQKPSDLIKPEPLSDEVGEDGSHEDSQVRAQQEKTDSENESLSRSARFPGPSTPQLEQASRLHAEGDEADGSPPMNDFACAKSEDDDDHSGSGGAVGPSFPIRMEVGDVANVCDQPNRSPDIESQEGFLCCHDSMLSADLQFEDIELSDEVVGEDDLSGIDVDPNIFDELPPDEALEINLERLKDGESDEAKEEALLLAEVAKAQVSLSSGSDSGDSKSVSASSCGNVGEEMEEKARRTDFEQSSGIKGGKNGHAKKKMKVDWTQDLHRRFVQAVEQLGVEKAIPSRILELMGVQCLTRHNVASHLQKYRSHKKHLQAREAEAVASTWVAAGVSRGRSVPGAREDVSLANGWTASRPSTSAPMHIQPRTSPVANAGGPALHVWGLPTIDQPPMHFWPKPAVWQGADAGFWHQAPTWGHPSPVPGTPFYPQAVMSQRLPLAPMTGVANMAVSAGTGEKYPRVEDKFRVFHPPKEIVDAAIKEVLRNPFTPLPLGLRPPPVESIISEFHRQGITIVPSAESREWSD